MVVTKCGRGLKRLGSLVTSLYTLVTTRFSRREDDMPDWARRFLTAKQTTDLARDPTDPKVTRQSAATIQGVLVPVGEGDGERLDYLQLLYRYAFEYYVRCLHQGSSDPRGFSDALTATMDTMMHRAAARTTTKPPNFSYISLDPRDYTVYTANHVDVPVISIHTRPERCWFLAVVSRDIIGVRLGRMKVGRVSDQGVYPITIRTNYRALTNKRKQEEVRDAFDRLTRA